MKNLRWLWLSVLCSVATPAIADEDTRDPTKPRMDIYGYAMLDMGYDFGQNDPAWFDVMRPTKLPSSTDQFGKDGRYYAGVRQSRFGVKGYFPSGMGEVKTIFEFEMFGVGNQAGETQLRLRHAWGELGPIGAGQSWSPFMDPDVFPNQLEYWGPNGMVFYRNVQLRFMPINTKQQQLWIALERPGASADLGTIASRVELQNVTARFPAPDISARYRLGEDRGHVQLSGILRYIGWDDLAPNSFNLTGHTVGWGVHLSGTLPVGTKDTAKASVVYGDAIENYMNDAPNDVAPTTHGGTARTPIKGDPLPVLGVVAFYDRYWNDMWSTSIGYSLVNIENASLQADDSFHRGQYALVNLLFYPAKEVMIGAEFQWARRENLRDGFTFDDYRVQLGFRYNFEYKLGVPK
jgi:hypothetical protein